GLACNGSSTPPMPTPPDRWQLAPICAQLPTVAQVSTMVLRPTQAPTLTKLGISTTPGAIYADRRTTAPGTARNPASRNRFSPHPVNFSGTLSHTGAPPGPSIATESVRRKDSSTAFLSHWLTCHPAPVGSATRCAPLSSSSSAASTACFASPP